MTSVTAKPPARDEDGSIIDPRFRKIIVDLATLVINVAVPVATVLLALVMHAPLSALFWRQFLKLSVPRR